MSPRFRPVPRRPDQPRVQAYRPGQASEVLTQHYDRMHPEALADVPDTQR